MKKKNIVFNIIFIFMIIFLILISFSSEALTVEMNDFEISFNIKPESIDAGTMVPMKQFQKLNMEFYEIDDKRTILNWKDRILFVDTESYRVNISGETVELENKPLKINNDLLIPYHLLEMFLEGYKIEEEGQVIKINQEKRGLEFQVIPEMSEITKDMNNLDIEIILKNKTEATQELTFNTGQKYDLKLTDQEGEIVYRWSRDKMFIQAIQHIKLETGEKETWQTSIPVKELAAGTYQLDGWLTARERIDAETREIIVKSKKNN